MLGQNYFQTRSKLGAAVQGLTELCEMADMDPGRVAMLRNLMANLQDPFLFVVAGEVNSGKSTLLNAIFGEDFCSTDVIPSTNQIAYFKYGKEAHEFEFSEEIIEIYRPNEFLRDFNLVDTPGTNSIAPRHQQVTEHFLPVADLVLFVFSVTNPWGATTWDFLDRIHNQLRKKVVFILQQCELRSEEEVAAILDHLQKTAKHRFNRQFPTFAVSAKQAFLAKTSGLDTSSLSPFSRIDDLERHISSVVESSETRLTKLIHAWRAACYVLGEVKEKLGTAIEIVRADSDLLSELEPAAEIQKGRTIKKCEPLFDALDQSFMSAGLQAEPLLNAEFRLLSSLTPSNQNAEGIEGLIFATTMKAVRHSVGNGAEAVEEDVQQLWERVSSEMQQHFHLELSVGENGQPDWSKSRKELAESVERATAEVLQNLDLKVELARRFSRRSRTIWTFIVIAMIATAGGVCLTITGFAPWNAIAYAVGGIFLALGAYTGGRSIQNIRSFYSAILNDHRDKLSDAQRRAFGVATNHFFEDFIKLFEPLRKVCHQHRETYTPHIKSIESCEKILAELERILTPVEKHLK